jgi:acetylornithine deacetylase/succinyl-diaminopimelate desuccinylase-like protein
VEDLERVSRRAALRTGLAGTAGLLGLVGAPGLAGCSSEVSPRVAPADLDALTLAREMVRLDTSHNGEGGITLPYARMLAGKFAAAGAQVDIIPTPKPDNAHFIARIRGVGRAGESSKPLLFLGHSDVVSVERDRWSVDPYAADVRDGWIYGRGSLDMKGANAAAASALLRLVNEGARFDRDIVYLADCDEEAGPNGTRWLAEHHWPKIDAGAVITEGGWILTRADGVTPMLAAVTVQDKVAANVDLMARGVATHSSKPMPDSAILRLDRAITRLADYQPPVTITPLNRGYFEALGAATDEPRLAEAVRGLLAATDQDGRDRAGDLVVAGSRYPWLHNALLRHTITQVIQQAGYRLNVAPGSATATMNLRMLPGGQSAAATLDQMRAQLGGDPQLTMGLSSRGPVRDTPEQQLAMVERRLGEQPSGIDSDVYRALERAIQDTYGGVPVTPGPFEAGTSGGPWRDRGIPVYGIYPYPVDNDAITRMHGTDERVRVDALRSAADLMYRDFGGFRV